MFLFPQTATEKMRTTEATLFFEPQFNITFKQSINVNIIQS